MKRRIILLGSIMLVFIMFINSLDLYAYADDNVVDEAKSILESYYIDKIPEKVLKATTMEEMIEYLGDPYTQCLTDTNYEILIDEINMKYVGIGVYIEMSDTGARVASVVVNSPAAESGIREGDIIVKVDGYMVAGLSLGQAMSFINGHEGIAVNLAVKRNQNVLNLSLIPVQLPYPSVTGEVIDDHIGYIRIITFGDSTAKEFADKLNKLEADHVSSFIIDLRNNPGGYLGSMLEIAEYFIGQNVAFIVEDKINKKYRVETYGKNKVIDKPVIFLMNELSASSSEILLAAAKDYNRGLFIGENTYGKGVAQNTYRLSDGSVLKTTIYRFFSPKGREINNVGISPIIRMNKTDPLLAAELLLGDCRNGSNTGKYIKVEVNGKNYEINLDNLKNKDYWEAYRNILDKASSIEMMPNTYDYGNTKEVKGIPMIKFAEMPKVSYKTGDVISFKLFAPSYSGKVQYRAIIWDEGTNSYKDLWSTIDRYYKNWVPGGREVFSISFPAVRSGNYRIKIFCKRSGVQNSKTALKGMNCDSYTAEIPFVVYPV